MRLVLIGANYEWSIERIFFKYLKELNSETYLYPIQNFLSEKLKKSIYFKFLFRFGLSKVFEEANKNLLDFIEEIKPDVIWIFKGMEILPKTLKIFRQKNITLINFNPDHPFIKSSIGSWNKNVYHSVPLYDLHFCYNKLLMKKIIEKYNIRAEWLPFGFDVDDKFYTGLLKISEIRKICFVGNPDNIRINIIKFLIKNKIKIDIYGNGWKKYFKENNYLQIFGAVYGSEYWEILRKYRVQLNIFRVHNLGSHNMRTFEIPGVGGIQLAPDSPEHREFFENEKEIFLYKNLNDLLENSKKILDLSEDKIKTIRTLARQRCIKSGYSYKMRVQFAWSIIKSL